MKRHCSQCLGAVFIFVRGRRRGDGVEHCDNHDLCSRCFRSLNDHVAAEKMGPKPWWAVRSTLRVLDEEPIHHGHRFSHPSSGGATTTPDLCSEG